MVLEQLQQLSFDSIKHFENQNFEVDVVMEKVTSFCFASFNIDSVLLCSFVDNMPNALWIWDVQKLSQAVLLLQVNSIRCKH